MDDAEIDDLCLAAGCQCKLFLDALEQARKDLDKALHDADKFKWQVRDTCARAEAAEAQRDAAQQSAEAARALLVEAGIVLKVERVTHPVRARIEAFLEPKV